MITRTKSALLVGAAVASLVCGTTVPAQAAERPSSGPLTNLAGDSNGCQGSVRLYGARIVENVQLTCPASADVHLERIDVALYEVLPTGTLRTVVAPGLAGRSENGGEPILEAGVIAAFGCNDEANKGTRTWLARATVKTRTSKDAEPYVVKLGIRKTLTCF